MATYVLGAVGTALGGPIGGMIGAALGGLADRMLISALTPGTHTTNTGPRLTEMSLTTSTEGAVIPKVFGRSRFGGQVIWTAQFKETEVKKTEEVGGKGGGGSDVTNISYTYSLSFAVAFSEGNSMAVLGRVWIDGIETDLSKFNFKFYPGSETQQPDSTMEAIEGSGKVPAYRGVAYLVFEDMPLADYGNRLPQVTAEIVVPLDTSDADDLSNIGRAWQLIPASGESIYGTQKYTHQVSEDGAAVKITENMHNNFNLPDAEVALDILDRMQPNLDAVSVVVSWFGTDLRAGECRIVPKIEGTDRAVQPTDWAVAGYTRGTAEIVTYDDQGNPIFGGTPSDVTVRELVAHIKNDLGKRVMFYPFILMDVPAGNSLPNPYSNNAATNGQPVFPWRGRITCSPAPGFTGTVDKTATAATQVNNWFTRTEGYRAMILHYANLLDDLLGAGDAFIIGSELVGLTTVRSSAGAGTYPAVNQFVTLAADVSAILPSSVKVGYAADRSEYHSHRPSDGTNDVIFNMDPLWASSHIDFIGIDNYLPMSDWRDGSSHLDYDAVNGPVSIYDRDYLASNIEGGEGYDWYYASTSDRDNQVRTPIVDGAYYKDWVFRQKDIRNWWANRHHNRPAGSEGAAVSTGDVAARYAVTGGTEYPAYGVDDFGNVSTRLVLTTNTSSLYFISAVAVTSGLTYTFTVRMRSTSGADQKTNINIYDGTHHRLPVTATSEWQTFSITLTVAASSINIYASDPRDGIGWADPFTDIEISVASLIGPIAQTAYVPSTKPIWFTEFGAPAIDKATNQPNVFYDPKSSESFFPYHSRGNRDDLIQRIYLEVFLAYWRDNGGSMVSIQNCFIWTWDARPFPAYPMRTDVWSDGALWVFGHWLTGRIDGAVLPRLVKKLCKDAGLSDAQIDVEGLYGPEGLVRGLLINSQMSTRDILESLSQAYEFKGFESAGTLKFVMDINQKSTELPVNDLVLIDGAKAPVKLTRGQETELPRSVNVSYMDEINDYQPASVDGHKGTGTSQNQTSVNFPLVWSDEHARALATSLLFKAWAAREKGDFVLPPSYARMDVGDLVYVPVGSRAVAGQLTNLDDTISRAAEFVGFDLSLLVSPGYETDLKLPVITAVTAKVVLTFLNLPLIAAGESFPFSMRLAAGASDGAWPGGVNLLRSDGAGGFVSTQVVGNRTSMGSLGGDLYTGPVNVWDRTGEIYVNMLNGGLSSLTEAQLLAGVLNAMAIENTVTKEWEVIQFAQADLQSPGVYKLTGLIRGQLGTEHVMRNPYPSGTRVVFIDALTIAPLAVSKLVATDNTLYRWGPSTIASSDDRYVEGNRQGTLAGYRPFSPCDFRVAKDSSNNDLALTWKRRTRINGDDWEQNEVPLNEEAEQYLLEIYDDTGVTLKRSEVLTSPNFTYTAAMQVTDHGSVQTDVFVKVSQYGTEYGNYGPALSGMFYMGSAF